MTTKENVSEALISVTSEPIPLLNLEGHLVSFKDDPLADQAWADLVGLQQTFTGLDPSDGHAVKAAAADLKRILGEFVVSGKEHWDKSGALGFKSLVKILNAYVEKVTDGIPT